MVAGRVRRLDVIIGIVGTTIAVVTVLLFVAPGVRPRVVAPALDLALDTIALVVTGGAASLAWMRFRERRDVQASYQAGAFVALAMANLSAVLTTVLLRPDSTLAAGEPGGDQLEVFLVGRLLCGGLLVVGGLRAVRRAAPPLPLLPAITVAVVMLLVIGFEATGSGAPAIVEAGPDGAPVLTPLGVVLHIVGAGLFAVAALLSRRVGLRDASVADQYIALALLIAAFAMLEGALLPGTHPGPVTIADVLWFAVNVTLLLSIEAEAQVLLGSTRAANRTLTDLREIEVDRAAFEERARLSRELHDGLAQDLWLAKLKVARLAALPSLDGEARLLVDEVAETVEAGLAEARQAVIAIRASTNTTEGGFGDILRRYLEDHGDRFGLRLDIEIDPAVPDLPARMQAELLRIAQEALANVRRHAGATTVRVRVLCVSRSLVLRIADDGCGFDVAEVGRESFGVAAMHERAELIGGQLHVHSTPGAGTEIEAVVPLPDPEPARGTVSPGGARR